MRDGAVPQRPRVRHEPTNDLDLDTSTGNVTLAVYSRKGSSDTGMINEGDYYRRQLSGNYYNFSMSNVKCKWTLW